MVLAEPFESWIIRNYLECPYGSEYLDCRHICKESSEYSLCRCKPGLYRIFCHWLSFEQNGSLSARRVGPYGWNWSRQKTRNFHCLCWNHFLISGKQSCIWYKACIYSHLQTHWSSEDNAVRNYDRLCSFDNSCSWYFSWQWHTSAWTKVVTPSP